jgi:putative transposase
MARSTYRLQQRRCPSKHDVRRMRLADTITEIHVASRGTYGMQRMRAALFP